MMSIMCKGAAESSVELLSRCIMDSVPNFSFIPYFSFISVPSGNSSLRVIVRVPSAAGKTTGASGAMNSASTCRHAPHGGLAFPFRFVTATAAMRIFGPNSETARATAARSAQIVSP
jgi:hypothetical protein